MSAKSKTAIATVIGVVICMLSWFWLMPEHWLAHVTDFATVTVDGQRIQADTYLAHPTYHESEAFLLVRTNVAGSYLFNFEDENYREVSNKEFVRFPGGVVIWTRLSRGPWLAPQPSKAINEFQITSSGRLIDVKF